MITASQRAVGTIPTLIATVPPGVGSVTVTNGGTVTIYLGAGGTTVTTTTGAPVGAGQAVTSSGYPAASSTALWAVSAGSVPSVGIIASLPQ